MGFKTLIFWVCNFLISLIFPIGIIATFMVIEGGRISDLSGLSITILVLFILACSYIFMITQLAFYFKIVSYHNERYPGNLWRYRGIKVLRVLSCKQIEIVDPNIAQQEYPSDDSLNQI